MIAALVIVMFLLAAARVTAELAARQCRRVIQIVVCESGPQ